MNPFSFNSWSLMMKSLGLAKIRLAMLGVVLVIVGQWGFQFYRGLHEDRPVQEINVEANLLLQAELAVEDGKYADAQRLYSRVIDNQDPAARSNDLVLVSALSSSIQLALENRDLMTAERRLRTLFGVTGTYERVDDNALWAMTKLERVRDKAAKRGMTAFAQTVLAEQYRLSVRLLGLTHPASLELATLFDRQAGQPVPFE